MTTKSKKRIIIILAAAGGMLLLIGGFFLFLLLDLWYGYESPVAYNYNDRTEAFDNSAFTRIVNILDANGVGYRIEAATLNNNIYCNVLMIQKVSEEKASDALNGEKLFEEYSDLIVMDDYDSPSRVIKVEA